MGVGLAKPPYLFDHLPRDVQGRKEGPFQLEVGEDAVVGELEVLHVWLVWSIGLRELDQ